MTVPDEFSEITRRDEPLAGYTWLKVGGPAQMLITPRGVDELQRVVKRCHEQNIPIRLLGDGSNILVRDEGVPGAVVKLSDPAFAEVTIQGNIVTAGAGALLSHVITQSAEAGLAGLEGLVGIPGTVGGALKGNSGSRNSEIGEHVRLVRVMTMKGEIFDRQEDELAFAYRTSGLNELAILSAEFELKPDSADEIAQRMKKTWVMKKASQPMSFQSAGCIFKNPRGQSAGALIEKAGLKGTRVGKCEISDRHANFIVTEPGATSADLLTLIDLVKTKVAERDGVDLELEVCIW
jgi:UDP-N-acetylmuramate dehydrogenase